MQSLLKSLLKWLLKLSLNCYLNYYRNCYSNHSWNRDWSNHCHLMDGLGMAIQLPERKNKMAQQHNTLNACDYSIWVSRASSIKHRASSIKLEWWSLMAQKQEECPARLHAAWVALGLPPARWACTQHLEMSFFFLKTLTRSAKVIDGLLQYGPARLHAAW